MRKTPLLLLVLAMTVLATTITTAHQYTFATGHAPELPGITGESCASIWPNVYCPAGIEETHCFNEEGELTRVICGDLWGWTS